MAELAINVVTFNTLDLTLSCLRKIHEATKGLDIEIVLVDNGTDGTSAVAQEEFPEASIHVSPWNTGFGRGHNIAAALSTAPYFLALNTDAILNERAVLSCVQTLRLRPKLGLVSPQLIDPDGSLQPTCHPYPSASLQWVTALRASRLIHLHPKGDGFLSGTCLFIRREAFESVGGFDDRYPMYFEEADLGWRLRAAGWEQDLVSSAQVVHLVGRSGGPYRRLLTAHAYQGRLRFIRDHRGRASAFSARLALRIEGLSGKLLLAVKVASGQVSVDDRHVISGITTDLLRLSDPGPLPSG
jgi:GT2 family glycosyltransferase